MDSQEIPRFQELVDRLRSFDRMHEQLHTHDPAVLVYLTDGYGNFPGKPSVHPVLWVVTPGGLASDRFPFGSVTRLR